MVVVKLFGLLRLTLNTKELEIKGTSVEEVLREICKLYETINIKELRNSIIFVNGTNIVEMNRFRTKVKDGDELQLFSPLGGG